SNGATLELRRGLHRLGKTENGPTSTKITGLGVGTRADGTEIPFRSRAQKLEYYDSVSDDWIEIGSNVLPAAANGEDVSFSPYVSLTGNQMWASSPNSSIYKIMVANPGSITDMQSTTYRGRIQIKRNRMLLWGRVSGGVKYTTI